MSFAPASWLQEYPEAGYANTSWWALRELLLAKGRLLNWHKRTRAAHMRHFAGVGYRETLLPVLTQLQVRCGATGRRPGACSSGGAHAMPRHAVDG